MPYDSPSTGTRKPEYDETDDDQHAPTSVLSGFCLPGCRVHTSVFGPVELPLERWAGARTRNAR
jgi:hypothetical protein